eukprot:TRINITY_DN67320_c0_g1_i1.p1 TRINITY_DN67320_c0_g1~~TRINITY_DN67320_c0_g1_i1.p1  ORF type:complete len:461 (-),score=37.79 TRINITY_DN67320_c0_g1_i1:98-1375(-)
MQPLPGGGGGGGGGGGSGGSGESHSISCAANCRSCSTDYTCDVCNTGYTRNTRRTCSPCSFGCDSCDRAGESYCDVCLKGFTLRNRLCARCADHCKYCDVAGPGLCEDCEDGYMLQEDGKRVSRGGDLSPTRIGRCVPCASGCKHCHDTTATGCDECYFSYQKQADGSCAFRTYSCLVIAVLLGVGSALVVRRCCKGNSARSPLGHSAYINQIPSRAAVRDLGALPSGTWRGYYTFSGTRHDVCEFNLNFAADTTIHGQGVDDVGRYKMEGLHGCNKIAFSKTYEVRSQNVSGTVHYGNKGHTVEYRGSLAGDSLGAGFRGTWTIRNTIGNFDGDFHIWPAMAGWNDDSEAHRAGTGVGRSFEEHECVVCFDRPISTCLRPCGHVAMCEVCASRLTRQICPLCRTPISTIERRVREDVSGNPHEE